MNNDSMHTCTTPAWYRDLTKLALRAGLAAVFIVHGKMKIGAWQSPDGSPLFKTLFVVEILGAVLVLLGLWTRWAAAALAIVMVGAIHSKITKGVAFAAQGTTGWEFDLMNLVAALALTGIGAGCYSLAGLMCKGKSEKDMKKKK